MRLRSTLTLLALLACPAVAEEPPTAPAAAAPTIDGQADDVLEAWRAGDAARLAVLAAPGPVDPWIVADELARRGEFDAALAFSQAAPRPDVEALPSYLAERRGQAIDIPRRQRLAASTAAQDAGRHQQVLDALGPWSASGLDDVVSLRISVRQAKALIALGRLAEALPVCHAASEAGERIGWLAQAAALAGLEVEAALGSGALPEAEAASRRCIALAVRRGDRVGEGGARINLALALRPTGRRAEAEASLLEGLALVEAAGRREFVLVGLRCLAEIKTEQGAIDQAAAAW